MVDVEPELADDDDVSPDSSCSWRFSFDWRRRRTARPRATSASTMIASVSVTMRLSIKFAFNAEVDVDRKLWTKSRMAELWAPSSEDIVDEMAGVELVWTMYSESSGEMRTLSMR